MNLPTHVQAFTATISVATGRDADTKTIQIQMALTRKLNSFLRQRHLKMLEQFDRFEFVGPDHIHADLGWTSEHQVWESLGQATRTIRFMDQTGLLPTSEEIYGFKTFSPQHRLPGQDHATTWRDPETNVIFVLDEPLAHRQPYGLVAAPCRQCDRTLRAGFTGRKRCGFGQAGRGKTGWSVNKTVNASVNGALCGATFFC